MPARIKPTALALCVGSVAVASAALAERIDAAWPTTEGSAVAAAFCGSCHSLALVQSQSLSRREWERVLVWMSKTQNMPAVAEPLRGQLLDFLAREFGADRDNGESLATSVSGLQGIRYRPAVEVVPER